MFQPSLSNSSTYSYDQVWSLFSRHWITNTLRPSAPESLCLFSGAQTLIFVEIPLFLLYRTHLSLEFWRQGSFCSYVMGHYCYEVTSLYLLNWLHGKWFGICWFSHFAIFRARFSLKTFWPYIMIAIDVYHPPCISILSQTPCVTCATLTSPCQLQQLPSQNGCCHSLQAPFPINLQVFFWVPSC